MKMIITDWMMEFFKKNPFSTTISLSLFMGGFLFLIYFFHIGYMPSLDIGNSIHLLFAMALTGGWLILNLIGLLIIPSLLWEQYRKDFLKTNNDSEKEEKIFLGILFLVQILFGIIVYLLSIDSSHLYISGLVILFLLGIIIWYFLGFSRREEKNIFVASFFISFASSIFSWLSVLIIYSGGDISYFFGIMIGIIVIMLPNIYIITQRDYTNGLIWGFFILVILMIFSKNYNIIPNAFIKNLHLGGYKVQKMHVKKNACDIFMSYNKDIVKTKDNESCMIKNLEILLKLGKETLVKVHTVAEGNISVTIPTKDILSYSWKE